jgi:serine protease Do
VPQGDTGIRGGETRWPRRLTARVACLLVATMSVPMAARAAEAKSAIDVLSPSIVRIAVVKSTFENGRETRRQAFGSGTIIDADGHVLTNHHVVGHARAIVCTLSNGQEIAARLVGTDPLADVAIIRLVPETPRAFVAARLGDSSTLRQGQQVYALGSPLSLSQSVTSGIVSNIALVLPATLGTVSQDGEDVGTIVTWIGHDAVIFPGNSGGPLVNATGEVVGINELGVGLSGAIPIDIVKPLIPELIRIGRVRRSWSGISLQPRVGGRLGAGALVASVDDASPASAAGVTPGDTLLSVNGTPIDAQFAEQLPAANRALLTLAIGEPATFVLSRRTERVTVRLHPIERPAAASEPSELKDWGIAAAGLTPLEARDLGRDSTHGVRVISVRPGGAAQRASPPLAAGDVVVAIDSRAVNSLSDLEQVTATVFAGLEPKSALVTFDRKGARFVSMVELGGTSDPLTPSAEVSRPWLPVDLQPVTSALAGRLGLGMQTGARVTRVLGLTPLVVDDILVAVDGVSLGAMDAAAFASHLRHFDIGARLPLTVYRRGTFITLDVTLAVAPLLPREMARYDDHDFEFRARDLASADRQLPHTGSVAGVLVDSVAEGGWTALAGVRSGDIIMAIDGRAVTNVRDLAANLRELAGKREPAVVFFVQRGARTLFLECRPTWPDSTR